MKKRQWMHAAAAVSAAALWGSTSPALAAQAAGASAAPAVQQEQQVAVDLAFDASAYKEQTLSIEGKKVKFRAYENIVYVRHPAAAAAQASVEAKMRSGRGEKSQPESARRPSM